MNVITKFLKGVVNALIGSAIILAGWLALCAMFYTIVNNALVFAFFGLMLVLFIVCVQLNHYHDKRS